MVSLVVRGELYLGCNRSKEDGLSYTGCYAADLGKLRQAEIVTGDPELQELKGEINTTWRLN
jgi:hypothetical protein